MSLDASRGTRRSRGAKALRRLKPAPLAGPKSRPPRYTNVLLSRASLYLALASAATILFSIAASQILLGLALAALLLSGEKLRLPRIWLPLSLFMLGTVISLAVSYSPAGLVQIRKFFVFTILLVIYSTVRDTVTARRLFMIWFAIGALVAARGLVQFVAKVREAAALHQDFYKFYTAERITGFMSHWMTFAGQEMVVLLMLTAFLFFGCYLSRRLWVWLLCFALIGSAEILNETRTVWVGLAVAGLWLMWWWKRWLVVAVPLATVALVWLAPGSVHDRFMSLFAPRKDVDSNQFRYVTRRVGFEMIKRHPFFGVGPEFLKVPGHLEEYLPADIPRPLPIGWYGHLHNVYLHYAAERGIPTLLMLLWMLGMILWDFFTALRKLPPGRSNERFLLQGGIATVLGIMVSGLAEVNLGDSEVLTVFLVVVACGYVARDAGTRQVVERLRATTP